MSVCIVYISIKCFYYYYFKILWHEDSDLLVEALICRNYEWGSLLMVCKTKAVFSWVSAFVFFHIKLF